jgi:hypothetical protein
MAAPAVPFRCRNQKGSYAMNVTETIRTFLEFFGDRGHQYYSRGFTLSGRPDGLSSNPAVVPGYVQ